MFERKMKKKIKMTHCRGCNCFIQICRAKRKEILVFAHF